MPFDSLTLSLLLTYLLAWVSEPVLAGFLNAFALFLVKSQIKVFTHAPVLMPAVGVATLCFALIRALPLLSPGTNTPSRHTLSIVYLIFYLSTLLSSLLYLFIDPTTHSLIPLPPPALPPPVLSTVLFVVSGSHSLFSLRPTHRVPRGPRPRPSSRYPSLCSPQGDLCWRVTSTTSLRG